MEECNTNCPWEDIMYRMLSAVGHITTGWRWGSVGQARVSPSASPSLLELPTCAMGGGGDLQQCGCNRPPLSSSVRPPYQMGRLTQYTRQYNLTQRSPAMLEIAAEFALVESNSLIKFGSQSYHHGFTRDKTNCPVHFNPVLLFNSGFD